MSKPRITLNGVIDTVDHAVTVRDAVAAELVGKDIFEEHSLEHTVEEDGSVSFQFDCRFNLRIERDAVIDWLADQIRNHPQVKNWFLEAYLWWHLCSHDDATPLACDDPIGSESLKWSKGDPWPPPPPGQDPV